MGDFDVGRTSPLLFRFMGVGLFPTGPSIVFGSTFVRRSRCSLLCPGFSVRSSEVLVAYADSRVPLAMAGARQYCPWFPADSGQYRVQGAPWPHHILAGVHSQACAWPGSISCLSSLDDYMALPRFLRFPPDAACHCATPVAGAGVGLQKLWCVDIVHAASDVYGDFGCLLSCSNIFFERSTCIDFIL